MEEEKLLSKKERRRLKKEQAEKETAKRYQAAKRNQVLKFVGWSIVVIAILYGLILLATMGKNLPPTSMAGHTEISPAAHILTTKMDIRAHKHMLEHADGDGPPGVIINYNCEDFECESDLIDKLAKIVQDYPANVYLAPWPRMSARLVITAEGRQQVLEGFNEQAIRDFIKR